MDIDKYQTGRKRLWAAIVDTIVFLPLALVEQWLYKSTNNISIIFAWTIFVAFSPLVYSIILHYKTGQTIGKWVAGVKVLDVSETRRLTFRQSVFRDSFYLLIAFIGAVYYGFQLTRVDNPGNVLHEYSSFSDNPVFWWALFEIITMLTNLKRRAVHDFLAKSVVIRTETSR